MSGDSQLDSGKSAGETPASLGYFDASRSLAASLIFILPLLAIYELGILAGGSDINAAAVVVKTPVSWLKRSPVEMLGVRPILILNGLFALAVAAAAWRLGRRGALHAGTFMGMALESAAYALALGPLVLLPMTARWQWAGFAPHFSFFFSKLVASCGAGLYEEILFRLVLLGSVTYLAKELGRLKPFTAGAVGLLFSGAVFSFVHFFSPGESVSMHAFIFRLGAGMALGVIFLTRGLGIAAGTHALYDVYVMCFTAG